jgi:hypothetical protein
MFALDRGGICSPVLFRLRMSRGKAGLNKAEGFFHRVHLYAYAGGSRFA